VIADGYSEPATDVIIKSLGNDRGSVAGVMSADDVLSVLALLRTAGVDIWVGGGWGIECADRLSRAVSVVIQQPEVA
jgi:hypothetical protein